MSLSRRERIVEFMSLPDYKPLKFDELVAVLAVPKKDIQIFKDLLEELQNEGKIYKTRKNRYAAPDQLGLVVGIFEAHERGFGFIRPVNPDISDVFVLKENNGGAMHRDMVVAKVLENYTYGKKNEGEIVRILKRGSSRIVGTFERSNRHYGFVTPDDKRFYVDIFVSEEDMLGAKTGDKVWTEITHYPEARRNPEGKVIEVLGHVSTPGTDILAVMKQYGLEESFPEQVEKEVSKIEDQIPESEIARRMDLRDRNIITIDGEDAKDLDDAISVEKLENGDFILGVHIADVSHYVKEGTSLDKEAFKRGTSVYLVDRVIPMLPKKLSNNLCSLNPDADKLALSVFMTINPTGKVVNYDIVNSIIRSKKRMTYNEVTEIFEKYNDNDPESNFYGFYNTEENQKNDTTLDEHKDLITMKTLAKILRKKRVERGAVFLDIPEAQIKLDEKGAPVEVSRRRIEFSNNLIEEFMLVCNETIAEHVFWANIPYVYRTHDEPDLDKMQHLSNFLYNMGYQLKVTGKMHPSQLQKIINKVEDEKELRVISYVMLRSFMKAKYSNVNIGHFAMAAKYYCHFTSPIRRYPDLIAHRYIKRLIKGDINVHTLETMAINAERSAIQSTEQEIMSVDAERDTYDIKKTEYMKERIGEKFTGVISAIVPFGMFVQLDNTVEGLVHLSTIEDDFYFYDENYYTLIGEHTDRMFKLGDTVNIVVLDVDVNSKKIDFILEEYRDNHFGLKKNKSVKG